MSTNVTFNGSSYTVPATADSNWGDNVSNYLIAISTGSLQKTGGTFTLTGQVDFGANYGLKSLYLKSRATNPASAGIVRLGNAENVSWRNAANSGDLSLTVTAGDLLQFNGNSLLDSAGTGLTGLITNTHVNNSAAIAYSKLNLATSIVNADINTSAAIAYSKLNLSSSIVNSDVSNSAAIAYSKLNLATSIVNADISASAAIAYSKLNLATSIVNADISASAAIALSKLATITASRALVSDGSGNISASSVTSTTLGYLDATSSVQTQIDAKQSRSTLTTKGDLYVATASATVARQGVGADGTFLKADSSQTNGVIWASVAGSAISVVTKTTTYTATTGDDVILCTSASPWTLTLYAASGNSGKILTIKKTSSDSNAITIDGNASETIDGSTTTTIDSQYETLRILCDGSNWHILERKTNSNWGSITITPAAGFGTTTNGAFFGRRVGDSLQVVGYFKAGTTAATAASIDLSGYTIDTAKIPGAGKANLGTWNTAASGASYGSGNRTGPVFWNSGTSTLNLSGSGSTDTFGVTAASALASSNDGVTFNFTIPISGWKGN